MTTNETYYSVSGTPRTLKSFGNPWTTSALPKERTYGTSVRLLKPSP